MYANQSDCSSYIVCQFMGTLNQRVDVMPCPSGLFYDPSINACNWPQLVNCQLAEISSTTPSQTTTPPDGSGDQNNERTTDSGTSLSTDLSTDGDHQHISPTIPVEQTVSSILETTTSQHMVTGTVAAESVQAQLDELWRMVEFLYDVIFGA